MSRTSIKEYILRQQKDYVGELDRARRGLLQSAARPEEWEAWLRRLQDRATLPLPVPPQAGRDGAGNKAPTWDHHRSWHYIVLRTAEGKQQHFESWK